MTESAQEPSSSPYPLMEDSRASNEQRTSTAAGTATYPYPGDMVIPPHPIRQADVEIDYYGLALVFLAPALGGLLYGYDIGASTFVLAMIRNSRDASCWWHHFPNLQQGLFISSLALGALIGSHVVLVYLAQSIGRRKEIRVAASLYIIGAMMNVMSGTILANTDGNIGFVTLITGRLFYGAGVGFTMHGAPTYMAEMSPSKVRGTVVSAKETVIVFGIVVGMLMGDLMSDYPDNWKDLYSFEILGAIPMLLLTFKIPRSKRWLLMKGYTAEAKESMKFVYKGDIDGEFQQMADALGALCCRNDDVEEEPGVDNSLQQVNSFCRSSTKSDEFAGPLNADGETRIQKAGPSKGYGPRGMDFDEGSENGSQSTGDSQDISLTNRRYRGIMVLGMALLVSQQASGQPSVLAYSRVLFEAAGWQGHASVVTVIIMGLTSSLTVAMVDRLGRKVLLLAGCVIMCTSLIFLAIGFRGWEENDNQLQGWQQQLVLWSMFVFIAGYQVGYGPITWTVLSEIYPSEIRGSAMALSVEVNFFFKFVVQLCFPMAQEILGWGRTFITFASLGVISFLFILIKVPETKGLSLEEIQVVLQGYGNENIDKKGTSKVEGKQMFASPLLEQGDHGEVSAQQKTLSPIV